jgi:N-acetylneuraminic acid mutarotase
MAELGTVETVLAEVAQALLPLRDALASPGSFVALLQELGWTATDIPQPIRDLGNAVETLYDGLRRLLGDGGLKVGGSVGADGSIASAGTSISPDEVGRVLSAFGDVITGIRSLAAAPASAFPATLVADGFLAAFPGQLIDFLVVRYLQRFHPSVGFALRALGVIKTAYTPSTGNRPPHVHLSLDLGDIAGALSDPSVVLRNAFGWGTPDFDFGALASQVDNLLMTVGADVRVLRPGPGTATAVRGVPDAPFEAPTRGIRAVLFERVSANSSMTAAIALLPVPADGTAGPGLAVLPSFEGQVGFRFELGPDIAVTIRSDLDLQGGIGLVARPGRGLDMVLGFADAGAPVHDSGAIEVLAERTGENNQPVIVFGAPDRTRLQFKAVGGLGGVRLTGGDVDLFVELDVRGLQFVFRPDEADGFIAALVPGDGISIGADLALGVSHRTGFYFRGTSNLEIQLPVHLQLGPIEIQGLTISASPSGGSLPIGLGASFKAELGPIAAVVQDIGLTVAFAGRPDHAGNLGPLDLSLAFKPPTGVGLSIDVGIVKGGGFLSFDTQRGEYAGALELEFADFLQLKAIGLISTRMPDGSAGFSLLVVIIAEFGSGIQLGYGFTLLAVGGLLGLNRGLNLQALGEGVRTGAIESVMFPKDVIANAPRILSDLNAFFPPEQGTFLVGPMAKIGWGTPTLVSISLGLIIEIPPGNIAILGVLSVRLPAKDVPLLVLQVNFLGALEVDKSRLWFVAVLFDSHVLTVTIEGGMGLLVAWGDNPDLVLTVGGFHPSYKAPTLPFKVPDRITVNILNEPGLLIRVSGYFAVTSNTVQFGAAAELRLGFSGFGIEGHLSFDALFQFSPFHFVIAISASVSLKAFGVGLFSIDLRFQLEGPAPWRAHGRGSISLLFFEISADFDITWGESRTTTVPPVTVLPLLAAEVDKLEGWSTRLPTGGANPLVNLRPLPETDELVLHPLGTLFVRQRALPLDVRVDKVGAQKATDGGRFNLAPAPDTGLALVSVTGDRFAMAQFQNLSDADKLSRPAYETQDAGVELTADGGTLQTVRAVRRSARYELSIIDSGVAATPGAARRRVAMAAMAATRAAAGVAAPGRFHNVHPAIFGHLLAGSSTSRSPISRHEATLRQPFPTGDTVRVADQRWVVAYVRSNLQAFPPGTTGRRAGPATFRSQAAAAEALAAFVVADPALDGQLHVIPVTEAALPPADSGTWLPVGVLPVPTSGVDAVLLPSGRVLVAGGADPSGAPLAAAALFDPTGNAWSPAAPLGTARLGHTTTALPDGRVLVTGGAAGATAEVYDPAAATWTATPPMGAERSGHTATVLVDGRVLVAGGAGPAAGAGSLASAEVYDPVGGTWAATGDMVLARTGHRAVLLGDGRVLVTGGALRTGEAGPDGASAIAYCEVYDPATGAWAPTGALAAARLGHQATPLPDGRVLVTGGEAVVAADGTYRPQSLDSAELYDPAAGTWSAVSPLPGGGRTGHRALLLGSGTVLVVGGTTGPERSAGFRSVTEYDPRTGTWSAVGGLLTGRVGAAAVELPDRRVLVAGGVAAAGAAAAAPGGPAELAGTAEVLIP